MLYWDDALITTGVVGDNLVQLGGVSGPAHTFFDRGQFGTEEWINTWWYANQSTLQVPFTIDSASWLVTGVLELPDVCNVDDKINMHVRFRNNQIALGSVSYAFSTNYPAFVTLAAVDTVTVVDTTFIFVEYNVDPSLSLQPTPIVFQWTVQASSAQFPTCNSVNNASCEVMATVLPLEAVTLSGRRMANAAHLHWQVQNEQQVQHYTLLRASGTRASSFEVVGHTPAIGQAHYGYIDTQLPAGNHYYRLQYTDADGAVGMANETVWISIGTDDIPDLAFAQSNHKLSLQDPEQLADITVWDLSGKQILSCRACNHLSTQSLAHGAYVATALEKSGKLATRRFTVMAR